MEWYHLSETLLIGLGMMALAFGLLRHTNFVMLVWKNLKADIEKLETKINALIENKNSNDSTPNKTE